MKQLQAGDKIVQQMSRDGAVELNKATGGVANISPQSKTHGTQSIIRSKQAMQATISTQTATNAVSQTVANAGTQIAANTNTETPQNEQSKRNTDISEDVLNSGGNSLYTLGGVIDRVQSERQAAKRRAARRANRKIFDGYKEKSNANTEISNQSQPNYSQSKHSQSKPLPKIPNNKSSSQTPRKSNPLKPNPLERVSGDSKDKPKTRLDFRGRASPPNGRLQHGNPKPQNGDVKLTHALDRPKREIGNAAHNEVKKHEGDNVGVQAAHFTEKAAEGAIRRVAGAGKGRSNSRLKFEPQRKLLRTEKTAKKSTNALSKRTSPSLNKTKSNRDKAKALKKAAYKRRLKRQYAKAFRQGNIKGAKAAAKSAKLTTRLTIKFAIGAAAKIKLLLIKLKLLAIKAVKIAIAGWKVILAIAVVLFLIILLVAGLSSCMSMIGGGVNTIIATSFVAEDEDIHGSHDDFVALENALADRIANIESEFPDFDEYIFNLDEIGHDPFVLISYLTARYLMFTREEVQGSLAALFARQYILTFTTITEIRTRTETREGTGEGTGVDDDGNPYTYTYTYTYTVIVEYEWHILVVTLVNRGLDTAALENLTADEAMLFFGYIETSGNRPELFP